MSELTPTVQVDPAFAYLLDWFFDLSRSRPMGFSGPQPISLSDVASWASLTGTIVRREEVAILRAMDDAFRAALAQEQEEAAERARKKANGK